LGNAAESIKQALDAMPDRYHGMAVATREFRAGDAFELELNQQLPLLRRKPSLALTVVEKLPEQCDFASYGSSPRRCAILLIGGDKTGNDRWYDVFVPTADALYDEHLETLKSEEK
jgi:hypothetical protein